MAMRSLGPTLDLHGGGTDLIFPHHECEIAQSESVTGEPFCRHWMHSAMVSYEGEKMSKSLGNLVFVSDLLKVADPRAIRLALMRHHYRAGFEWHDTDLDEGTALLHRLRRRGRASERARPRAVRRARARRDRRRPRRAARARGARRPRERDPLRRRRRRLRPKVLRRARPRSSASTSIADAIRRAFGSLHSGAERRRRPAGTFGAVTDWPITATITITLPDGSTRSVAQGRRRPATSRRRSGKRLGKDALAATRRRRVGRPRPTDRRATPRSRSSSPTTPRRARGAAPLDGARAWPRPSPTSSRAREYAIGPAIEDGFYYDFELPDGGALHRRRPRAHRGADARDRRRGPAVRARRGRPRRGPRAVRRPAVQADIIERVDASRGRRRRRSSPCTGTRAPTAPTFVDLCRGPHVPSTRRLGAFKLTEGRRRLLARRRARPDAPAHLRHGVGVRRPRSRSTCTGSRRPSGATTAGSAPSSTCSRSPRRSAPGSRCSTRRARSSASSWRTTPAQRHEAAGYEFVNTPHITKANLFETSGHLDWFADGMFPPMDARRGRRGTKYYLKPMNCPFHILIYKSRHALVPRAAAAAASSSARSTATRGPASCTA